MMKSVINTVAVDTTKQPMFFGEDLSVQRYDKFREKKFYDSWLNQLEFFWRPEEFNLSRDKADFENLTENEKSIFTSNLKYQILLDSVQSRGISLLAERTTIPELEAAMSAWQFYETLHSYSYTYIIKNVYDDPSHVFDTIMDNEAIVQRASSVTQDYDKLINNAGCKKEELYLALISVNILEGIRFYVSFACAYAFAQNKKMEGNAKIIKLINRDENLHLALTQNVIKRLELVEDEGFVEVTKNCEERVIQMYEHAANEEMEWAKHLMENGTLLGLTEEVLCNYVKYLTNIRMASLKLPKLYEDRKNPIPWIHNWSASKSVQNAPQETELESYRIGAYDVDLGIADFSEYKDNL
jgi:ribonucleoside-diphosphate reductase beta chain